ncbi:multicopper oxidase domain-containing protein [Methylocystis sp. MJC1]|jgi:nitrite reductase (NO-forming)|uniref:multicopper oxidase domain-containing protein n=1 Tax=Methylocystis sp. MJC1 TaxID=2654282 RepID=UPI0013EE0B23|nr:multicopper oxidase domain-containing protein [Methylocystis sp. MJC1]KAF2991646.1 Copper-containing nitrite reductase [Methylocystis sp. MJC1]MBU6527115.1 multicopper oxidase domain-containing protein [Methylocystis sp. MJC1]UZX13551.1 multicopper oxidase domain-containing protein [Methylocystis sp. MJC1]
MKPDRAVLLFCVFSALLAWAPLAFSQEDAPARQENAAARTVVYTLRSGIAEGRLVFLGVGGAIDGKVNPELVFHEGERAQINLVNGEGAEHDIVIEFYGVRSNRVVGKGASGTVSFFADKTGAFSYYCSVPGHRDAGMQGKIRVEPGPRSKAKLVAPDISRDPSDVPRPIGARGPRTLRVDLTTIEIDGRLDDKTTYQFWTFGGKVPGPFIRARVGDTLEVHLKNDSSSVLAHSVDLHAAIGPGGGARFTQADPGEEKVFSFEATTPGLFVYHCATPSIAQHVANGMYGLVLIEPEGGLPKADREFYVMQGELYTTMPFGTQGRQELDYEKLMAEQPEYFLFNGAVGALTAEHPLRAERGENVRIFFGVGGPNFTSSLHLIGGLFDRVRRNDALKVHERGAPTVSVAPGDAATVEFNVRRGGQYVLADHALSRMERGLVGDLIVEGPRDDALMHEGPESRRRRRDD